MSAYRVLLVFAALFLGSQTASIGDPNGGVHEFEEQLLLHFNSGKWTSTTDYVDEPGGLTLNDNYLEIRKAKLITTPTYKASSIKLDIERNLINMSIAVGKIDMKFDTVFANTSFSKPRFVDSRIHLNDVIMTGQVSTSVEGSHFMPQIYDFKYTNKAGVVANTDMDEHGKSLGVIETSTFGENYILSDTFQVMTKPILHQLQMDVKKILKACLKKISTDTVFKTGKELENYSSKVSLATKRANKIVDDVCNSLVLFEKPIYDNGGYVLPQIFEGILKLDGIKIDHGTIQFGVTKRNGDFNSYDDEKYRYISGYVILEEVTLLNNYTTKYDTTPVTGLMKTVATNVSMLIQMKIVKGSCKISAELDIVEFGDVETHVTPEDTGRLLRWNQEELRLPLVGHFRINMVSTALKHLVRGIELGYGKACKFSK